VAFSFWGLRFTTIRGTKCGHYGEFNVRNVGYYAPAYSYYYPECGWRGRWGWYGHGWNGRRWWR